MKVSVLIPYKQAKGRSASFEWIQDRYQDSFPEFEICIGTDNSKPFFNRSAARNDAFSKSTGEILIINDADTFINSRQIKNAIKLIKDGASWVIPYTEYLNITKKGSERILDLPWTVEVDRDRLDIEIVVDKKVHPPDGSVSGVIVVPAEAYEMVRGYDELFNGWAYEDDAFAASLDTLWGYHDRLPGFCCHLWHPPSPDGNFKNPLLEENRNRWLRYKSAIGNTKDMSAIRNPQ